MLNPTGNKKNKSLKSIFFSVFLKNLTNVVYIKESLQQGYNEFTKP